MALQRYTISGYGQIELNNVAFRRTGAIEAQCALDTTDFATDVAENGMLLAVDNINRTIKYADDDTLPVAINYSSEHMYDERLPGLKNFYLGKNDFYPRLGYLTKGDKFTTNCIGYDDGEFADDDAVDTALAALGTTPVYGTYCSNGSIKLTGSAPTTQVKLQAVQVTTMPDGTWGVKFQVLPAAVA